jgi:hypothetical protein
MRIKVEVAWAEGEGRRGGRGGVWMMNVPRHDTNVDSLLFAPLHLFLPLFLSSLLS